MGLGRTETTLNTGASIATEAKPLPVATPVFSWCQVSDNLLETTGFQNQNQLRNSYTTAVIMRYSLGPFEPQLLSAESEEILSGIFFQNYISLFLITTSSKTQLINVNCPNKENISL